MAAKEKKGLGTGLAALFGEEQTEENELQSLPIAKVEPREEQPRYRFEESALQELSESIARYGIIQPITVRKLESGYYQIIAGERRWRAARLAGLDEIPARVIEADDRRTAELALVENLQREDLNPIEEAKGYQTLINDYGMTQEEAAKSVGRSRPAVTNALRLLGLGQGVMQLVEEGELSAGHARALLPLSVEEVQYTTALDVIKRNLSVRKTEALVARMLKETEDEKPADRLKVDYAADISQRLTNTLGRKVKLIDGRKGGRIELEYYSPDDREELIDLLQKLKKI